MCTYIWEPPGAMPSRARGAVSPGHERPAKKNKNYMYMYICIYTYMYTCICVCVYMCIYIYIFQESLTQAILVGHERPAKKKQELTDYDSNNTDEYYYY